MKSPRPPWDFTEKLLLLLIGLSLVGVLANFWRPPIFDIDEAAYAENGREFLASGDWLTPTFRGVPAFHKPPFHLWLVGLAQLALGINEFAVRLTPVLCALGTLWLSFLLGVRFYSRRVGLLAVLFLTASAGFYTLTRHALTDMTLAFLITLAFYAYLTTYAAGRATWRGFLLLYGAVAAATLTKGPIGVGIPFSVFFLAHLWTSEDGRSWREQATTALLACLPLGIGAEAILLGSGTPIPTSYYFLGWLVLFLLCLAVSRVRGFWRWHLLGGFLLWAALTVPWYGAMYQTHGWKFIESNLLFHNLQKFFEPGHYEAGFASPYFLVHSFLWYFFPWNLFFLVGVWRVLTRPAALPGERLRERLLLLWFFFPFLVFSFSKFKLPTYLAPMLPACALLAAARADELFATRPAPRLLAALARLGGALTILAVATLVPALLWFCFPPDWELVKHLSLLLPVGATLLLVAGGRGAAGKRFLLGAALALTAGWFFIDLYLQPRIIEYMPYRDYGAYLRERLAPAERPFCYKTASAASLAYYSHSYCYWTDNAEEFRRFFEINRGLYLLTSPEGYEDVQQLFGARFELIEAWPQFHISRLNGAFLRESTRPLAAAPLYLLHDREQAN